MALAITAVLCCSSVAARTQGEKGREKTRGGEEGEEKEKGKLSERGKLGPEHRILLLAELGFFILCFYL